MSQKVALVTGGAIRVGRAIVLALAEQGFTLAIHYCGSGQEAKQLVENLKEKGLSANLFQADLSSSEQAKQLIEQVSQQLGQVEVLINSAAIFPDDDNLSGDFSNWSQVMDLNLKAPLILSQAFAQQQCFKNGQTQGKAQGHIINILDARINKPAGDHLVYRLSKSALQHLTQCLAQELAPQIQVNGLALGAIMAPPGADDVHFVRMSKQIPLRRTGNPDAIGEGVKFLLSQEFITGTILPIDGGEFL